MLKQLDYGISYKSDHFLKMFISIHNNEIFGDKIKYIIN